MAESRPLKSMGSMRGQRPLGRTRDFQWRCRIFSTAFSAIRDKQQRGLERTAKASDDAEPAKCLLQILRLGKNKGASNQRDCSHQGQRTRWRTDAIENVPHP